MNNLEVVWELTKTDFKLKYAGSMLGILWSLLKPLAMLGVLYLVFTFIFNNNIDSYALFLLLGIIIWNYFVDSINDSTSSIIINSQILTKTNLNPSLLIFSSCLHGFITFILNLVAFFVIFFIAGKSLGISALLFIPLVVILLLVTISAAHIVVIFSSRYSDFKHIWDILIQIGFWITPIFYAIEMVPQTLQYIIMMNPIAAIIDHSRDAVIYHVYPSINQSAFLLSATILLVIISRWFYVRNKVIIVDKL